VIRTGDSGGEGVNGREKGLATLQSRGVTFCPDKTSELQNIRNERHGGGGYFRELRYSHPEPLVISVAADWEKCTGLGEHREKPSVGGGCVKKNKGRKISCRCQVVVTHRKKKRGDPRGTGGGTWHALGEKSTVTDD